MPTSSVRLKTEGHEALKRYSRALRRAGYSKDITRDMRANFRKEGRPVVAAVKSAALAVNVTSTKGGGAKSTGLRIRVAHAVALSATSRGIQIYVRVLKGAYGKSLPRYLGGELGRYKNWRHPVYGHSDRWTQQSGSPYFYSTINSMKFRFRAAALNAIAEAESKLR